MRTAFAGISLAFALGCACLVIPRVTEADSCMVDLWSNGMCDPPTVLFPNWGMVWAGSFDAWMCLAVDGCDAPTENITAITVVNFGSALPVTDIDAVYWKVSCPAGKGEVASGLYTLTYKGIYSLESGNYPAWTWTGSTPDLSGCDDLCVLPPCGGYFTIDIYVDIASCPTPGNTVAMGFANSFHMSGTTPEYEGPVTDNDGCQAPYYDQASSTSQIQWTYKVGSDYVSPGDKITYVIYYGKPGTTALSSVVVMDSQPPYTHYVPGSASPAPDISWDPNFGPPLKLKWTITPVPGNLPTNWGPTNFISFQLSADWGNGENFESGSGNVAAPEGQRLNNQAQVFWNGTDCGTQTYVNQPVNTVVKRFMFWMLGDNDVLFSQTYGQPADEIIYSIFVKNVSETKTWWDVHLWDSVPVDLDVWAPDCGFLDPCQGWTMTPSGCSAASPGVTVTAMPRTVMTWKLDMPPGMTLELRWKAKVSTQAQPKGTVINQISLLEYGHSRIVDGTGHSIQTRRFTHLAPIILPTMYTSYVGYVADYIACPGFLIDFFPLNKKTVFELRGLDSNGVGLWGDVGGKSASIMTYLGDCYTGFAGGGYAGCRAERAPAKYDPAYQDVLGQDCALVPGGTPVHSIYKLTSNSPVLWQLLTHCKGDDQDNHTYAPATTLTYTGLMHYVYRRASVGQGEGFGDCLSIVNTSVDPYGVYRADLETSVFEFVWDPTILGWNLYRFWDIDKESQVYDQTTTTLTEGPYRTVSSEGQLIIDQGMLTNNKLPIGGNADNHGAFMPTRETGNVVAAGPANFYGLICEGGSQGQRMVVGNAGGAKATYRIWRYMPYNTVAGQYMPPYLNSNSGYWTALATHDVPAGIADAENPRVYPGFANTVEYSNGVLILFKVEAVSGGPIQVNCGTRVFSQWAGGAVMHSSDGKQTGLEFWLHHTGGENSRCDPTAALDVFCSKNGMIIRAVSEDGFSACYTTDGPDQCVAFRHLSQPASKRNYRINVLAGASQGNVIVQYIQCTGSEKGYTAPFLQEGIHYEIIAPPVVFVNQSFWITIIVKDTSGFTKCDYTGTTSFTSTDPAAKVETKAMDSYNYTWKDATDCGVKMFMFVSYQKAGMQTLVAMDTLDGSINGLTAILVVSADIKLEKKRKLTVAASGDTVQFQICWSNYSTGSGFSFTITDAVPMGTTYVPELASTMLCQSSTPLPGYTVFYSTATTTTPPGTFTSIPGTSSPLSNTRWLRWTIRDVYVRSTGCVCFKVSVN